MSDTEFLADLADLFVNTVTIEPLSSRDAAGKPTYGTAQSYSARIVIKGQALRTLDGTVILGRGLVDILTTGAIGTQDRLTLPAAFVPRQPPILAARLVYGESQALYTQILIG